MPTCDAMRLSHQESTHRFINNFLLRLRSLHRSRERIVPLEFSQHPQGQKEAVDDCVKSICKNGKKCEFSKFRIQLDSMVHGLTKSGLFQTVCKVQH